MTLKATKLAPQLAITTFITDEYLFKDTTLP